MSVKVGMILDVDFPPDDRPEKEALSLIKAGYDVFLLCYSQSGKLQTETYQKIKITRFRLSRFLHNKLSAAYLVLPFYRWIWAYQIRKFIKNNHLDILHVHDLPLSDIAAKYANKYNLKLVCDQHEYWSNWIGNTYHYNTPLGKIVKFFSNWKKFERVNLINADLVITVSEHLRKCYIDEIPLNPPNVITIPNTPSYKIFNSSNIDSDIINRYSQDFMLFYAGVIDILRGVDLIVSALPEIKKKIPRVKLVLAGRLARGCRVFELSRELGVEENIEFVGWLAINQVPSYISASKICVFTPPADKSDEINKTIATKIYQYAAMKRPIIISQAQMMKDFVEKHHFGLSLDKYLPESFAKTTIELFNNYDKYSNLIEQTHIQLTNQPVFYWEETVKPLISYYSIMSEQNNINTD